MKMKKKFPLLTGLFLDFTYTVEPNFESRIFLTLPHKQSNTTKNNELLTIGMEMNSLFSFEENKDKIGIFAIVEQLEEFNSSSNKNITLFEDIKCPEYTLEKNLLTIYHALISKRSKFLEKFKEYFLHRTTLTLHSSKFKHLDKDTKIELVHNYNKKINAYIKIVDEQINHIINGTFSVDHKNLAKYNFGQKEMEANTYINNLNKLNLYINTKKNLNDHSKTLKNIHKI